jgi:hypothetical protein
MFLEQMAALGPAPPPAPRRGRRGGGGGYGYGTAAAAPRIVVRAVERIQNWRLWTGYYLKRE